MVITPRDGVAWVTGASQGLGEAVALRLARDGWTVAASARSGDKLDALAARAPGPGRIESWPVDVTDADAVGRTIAALHERHGAVALAILNAGTYDPDSAETLDLDRLRAVIDLNLMSVLIGVEALMPGWREAGRGHLQIVSSVSGYRGLPRAVS